VSSIPNGTELFKTESVPILQCKGEKPLLI